MKHDWLNGLFELKAQDAGARTFEGALSTSHIDRGDIRFRDIVHPGAFKRTIHAFKSARDAHIPLLDTHNIDSVMHSYGHLLDAEERLTGKTLRYDRADGGVHEVPEMLLDTKWQVIDGIDGERLLDRLRSGTVRKMSMGYAPNRADYVELKTYGRTRNLREVELREGSLVLFAMNPTAAVNTASVKSLIDAARAGTLTGEDRETLRALLDAPPAPVDEPPADTPKGLAPDDPRRIALSAQLRGLKLRSLTL
jgi:HK97 family phage prohead protease